MFSTGTTNHGVLVRFALRCLGSGDGVDLTRGRSKEWDKSNQQAGFEARPQAISLCEEMGILNNVAEFWLKDTKMI